MRVGLTSALSAMALETAELMDRVSEQLEHLGEANCILEERADQAEKAADEAQAFTENEVAAVAEQFQRDSAVVYDEMQADLDNANAKCESLVAETRQWQQRVDDANHLSEKLRQGTKAAEDRAHEAEQRAVEAESFLQRLKDSPMKKPVDRSAVLRAQEAEKRAQEAEQHCVELIEQQEVLVKHVDEAEQRAVEAESSLEGAQEAALRREEAELRAQVSEQQCMELIAQQEGLVKHSVEAEQQQAALEIEAEDASERAAAAEEQVENLVQSLKDIQVSQKIESEQYSDAQSEISRLELLLASASDQCTNVSSDCSGLISELKDLRQELHLEKSGRSQLEMQLKSAEEQVEQLVAEKRNVHHEVMSRAATRVDMLRKQANERVARRKVPGATDGATATATADQQAPHEFHDCDDQPEFAADAVVRIQATERGRQGRIKADRRHGAVVKIQATERGRQGRVRVRASESLDNRSSQVDAAQAVEITPQEVVNGTNQAARQHSAEEAYLLQLFEMRDVSHGGLLPPSEICLLLQLCGTKLTDTQLQQIVAKAIVNPNGMVEYNDFVPVATDLLQNLDKLVILPTDSSNDSGARVTKVAGSSGSQSKRSHSPIREDEPRAFGEVEALKTKDAAKAAQGFSNNKMAEGETRKLDRGPPKKPAAENTKEAPVATIRKQLDKSVSGDAQDSIKGALIQTQMNWKVSPSTQRNMKAELAKIKNKAQAQKDEENIAAELRSKRQKTPSKRRLSSPAIKNFTGKGASDDLLKLWNR